MSGSSPRFNEPFAQEESENKECHLDSNLLAEGKEYAEQFDRKIVGFDSIDDLFSSLAQPKSKRTPSDNTKGIVGQSPARPVAEQQASKNSSSRLPNITINYSQPSARDSSRNPNTGELPTKWIEGKAFKKKITQYQQRIGQVPIATDAIEYYDVMHIINHEAGQEQAGTVHQTIRKMQEKFQILAEKNRPIEERPSQDSIKPSTPSLLQRNKSEPSLPNQGKPIKFQNPNRLRHQPQKALYSQQALSNLRFVTTDSYDYAQRRLFLNQIDSKMQYLRQMQVQLLKK